MAAGIVVVGSVNVDLVTRLDRLPRPGETVLGGVFSQHPGGKGGNQAVAAARLDARVSMVGCVGADAAGGLARRDLQAAGVDCRNLTAVADFPTGTATVLVDRAGENLIAVASGANASLDADTARAAVTAAARPGDVVLASLEVPLAAVAAAAEAAVRVGADLVLNPAPARRLPRRLVAGCAVLTPNEHELALLPGPEQLLAEGAGAVVVTLGARGARLHRPGRPPHYQPSLPASTVDTTGAGDAFTAALGVTLAAGCDLESAVRTAAAAAAAATEAPGARGGLPTRIDLERRLLSSSGRAAGGST